MEHALTSSTLSALWCCVCRTVNVQPGESDVLEEGEDVVEQTDELLEVEQVVAVGVEQRQQVA